MSATHTTTFETLVATERTNLLRFCTHLTGSAQAAEDLTQETLLTAWRRRDTINDPSGLSHWLTAIARNVCRHWHRSRARHEKNLPLFDQSDGQEASADFALVDDFDIDVELERGELITLLDRAMAMLQPETRGLLVQHYIEESPQAELAARTGLSTSAVGVRLHRGKLALRKTLLSEFREDAVAYGLVSPTDADWAETLIWCVRCGQHRLEGQFNHASNFLHLRCPGCRQYPGDDGTNTRGYSPSLEGVKAFKPAWSRILKWSHHYHFDHDDPQVVTCYRCGRTVPLRIGIAPWALWEENSIYDWCAHCNSGNESNSWHSRALSLPQVRQFWKENPRMAELPERHVEIDGSPSVLVGYESVTDNAHIEVGFSTNTFDVIYVD